MLPFQKAYWYLGSGRMAMMLEQDRRHWLLKTDRLKQVEDSKTGNTFQGQIDNIGSEVVLETAKLPVVQSALSDVTFTVSNMADIFEITSSALPYTTQLNGLANVRVISTQYQINQTTKKNYKIQFTNAVVCQVPIATSITSDHVVAFPFIKTTTNPTIWMLDSNDQFTISETVSFNGLTNVVYYYPLADFKPFEITNIGSGTYETEMINQDNMIGYPAIWFTCDETNLGPKYRFTDENVMYYGNPKSDQYQVNVYCGLESDGTPNGAPISDCTVQISPSHGTFHNDESDFNIPIDRNTVTITDQNSSTSTVLTITTEGSNSMTMAHDVPWTYVDEQTYQIDMGYFAINDVTANPGALLTPIFNIKLSKSIPFVTTTTDYGYAGVNVTAKSQSSTYPYHLNEWDGLPGWIAADENDTQRLVMYAIHNTPTSSEEQPMTKQTAALLLDPGVPASSSTGELQEDEIGRVYVLSNDDTSYHNNHQLEYPKPARTVARICDVPTSVMQLTNISGIAPTPIVDPKYVRSQASYKEADQDRVNNTLKSRWVKPSDLNSDGIPVCDVYETNPFIFDSVDHLNEVDLIMQNDYREHTNMNATIDPTTVSLFSITAPGSGYATNDIGTIVIGGFAFTYVVGAVDSEGGVTEASVTPDGTGNINISNFDMEEGTTGITKVYGTSPLSGNGTGLKLQLQIADYIDKLPKLGNVYPDLFAFVHNTNGLYLYSYNTSTSKWVQSSQLTTDEVSDPTKQLSTRDAYIHSILPTVQPMPVAYKESGVEDTSIQVLATASCVNIIDDTKTPVTIPTGMDDPTSDREVVDLNKFYCHLISEAVADSKTTDGVRAIIERNDLGRFDSYLIWRWVTNDPTDRRFKYGIVHRSFNNLQSTDSTTFLPKNELVCKKYVHTNASTIIVWNIPTIGPMTWVYDPTTSIHESYALNATTRDLYVGRDNIRWENIEIYNTTTHEQISMVDSDGKLTWNVMMNTTLGDGSVQTPIYQQPRYTSYEQILSVGKYAADIPAYLQPRGNWRLVFPRVQSFTFKNDVTNTTYNPVRLHVIRGVNVSSDTEILDQYGEPINAKVMVINNTSSGSTLNVYNTTTGTWDTV